MKSYDKALLARNLPLLNAFGFCAVCMVIMPVIVPLFESRGLTLAEVFMLQAIFGAGVVLLEVPSGYIADRYGRKLALLVGAVFHGLGYSLLGFTEGFVGLVVFELTLAVGVSLFSGADLALLYETQTALGYSRVQQAAGVARLRAARSLAEGVAALAASVALLVSLEATVWVNAVVGWAPLLLAFWLVEAPFQRMPRGARANLKRIMLHLFCGERVLRLTILSQTVCGLLTFYAVWLIQPYWGDAGVPLAWFGMLWAVQSFVVALTSRFAHEAELRFGAPMVIAGLATGPVVAYAIMAWPGGAIGILAAIAFGACRGLNYVVLTDAMNARIPGEFRATANSVVGLVFRGGFILTGPLVGLAYDLLGMTWTLSILAGVSLAGGLLCMVPLSLAIGAARDPVRAGVQG